VATTVEHTPATARQNWSVMAYHVREGFREEVSPDEVPGLLLDPEWQLWLDVTGPTDADLQFMREVLRFHPLAIEDVAQQHQRPKIDQYEDHAFLVLYAGHSDDPMRPLNELGVFAGKHYLVTTHRVPLAEIETARQRWKQAVCDPVAGLPPGRSNGSEIGLYVLLDSVVDAYFPLLDDLGEELERVETQVFTRSERPTVVRDLLRLRKRLLQLRRVLAPTRDVVNQLARRELDMSQSGLTAYYLDVYDHLVRVVDTADIYRDMIGSALDAYLSVSSVRLNETMRTMTALATILMSMTLISSIYGMNFAFMPELKWALGYPFALGLMLLVGLALLYWFRRRGWL
jgi:magnesium transporter